MRKNEHSNSLCRGNPVDVAIANHLDEDKSPPNHPQKYLSEMRMHPLLPSPQTCRAVFHPEVSLDVVLLSDSEVLSCIDFFDSVAGFLLSGLFLCGLHMT